MTGYGDVDVSVRAVRQGAAEFLTKPVAGERLLQTVREAIARSRTEQVAHDRQATLRARYHSLSPQERQRLACVVDGCTNKHIA